MDCFVKAKELTDEIEKMEVAKYIKQEGIEKLTQE